MIGLPKRIARRWYLAGTISSIAALGFILLAQASVRIAYPLAFIFTMAGVLAITRPGWEWPQRRPRIVFANTGAFLVQVAVLYLGLTSSGS